VEGHGGDITTTSWQGHDFWLSFDFRSLSFWQMCAWIRWNCLKRKLELEGKSDQLPDPPPEPNYNYGEGCCCVPSNQEDPSEGSGKGRQDDDYAQGTYYLGMLDVFVVSGASLSDRGDLGVIRRLQSDGIARMRWVNCRTINVPRFWEQESNNTLRYHNQTVPLP